MEKEFKNRLLKTTSKPEAFSPLLDSHFKFYKDGWLEEKDVVEEERLPELMESDAYAEFRQTIDVIFTALGIQRNIHGNASWLSWTHTCSVSLLVSWTLIGWIIAACFALAGSTMPFIPGWLEIAVTDRVEIPGGIAMGILWIFSHLFTLRYFYYDSHRIANLIYDVLTFCGRKREDVTVILLNGIRLLKGWATLQFILCWGTTVLINFSRPADENYFLSQPIGALIWDCTITIIAWVHACTSVVLIVVHFGCLCNLHIIQIDNFAKYLSRGGYSAGEGIQCYHRLLRHIRHTSQSFQLYLSVCALLLVFTLAVFVTNVVHNDHNEALGLRAIYIAGALAPVGYIFWQAACVSAKLELLPLAVPTLANIADANFIVAHMSAGYEINQVGFALFGLVLKKKYIIQGGYAIAAGIVAYVQYLVTSTKS